MSALPTDFNDLAAAQGLAAVSEQLEPVIQGVADWPAPILTAAEPAPLTADLLPAWLGRYVGALAEATQTPATMSALFALSVVSACVQRRYVVAPLGADAGYTEPATFWSLSVAASGSRKSAIVDALARPLAAWEKRAGDRMRRAISVHNSRQTVIEATIARLKTQAGKTDDPNERERLRQQIENEEHAKADRMFPPRVFIGDTTVERLQSVLVEQGSRMAVLSDEGGLFNTISGSYGGGAGPALDVLLQGHSGGSVRVERGGRHAYIDRAALTLGLMLQPDLLNDAAGSNRFRASGLMARFAYALPGQVVGGRNVRAYKPVPADLRTEYEREVDALLGDPMEGPHLPPHQLPLADDAREAWLDYAQEIENALGPDGELAAIADWGAKLAGMAARIALLFELVTSGPCAELVCLDSTQRAIALCRLLVPHAKAAFRLLAADEADRDADAVLAWVVRSGVRGEFKQADAHFAMRSRFTKKERLVAALQRLQANGCVRHELRKNEKARPSAVWHVNPRLFLQ
ncbi:YfjI family protein [Ottowia oryzae]|uniref:DUF3987 domain-containing protein n=1 Tax=Ottowia oryzae TaxID=2109914 RepID=A0A2S0MHS2_9BURK|nr:YfjI family protein [Ottowia oryzae]AVO35367.1 hypothetical protein C6570_14890 [Ottowia oryzae]